MSAQIRLLMSGALVAALLSSVRPAVAQTGFASSRLQLAVMKNVADHAQSKKGEKVGRGECTELVDAALAAAKAKPKVRLRADTPQETYIWGTAIKKVTSKDAPAKAYAPGLIIQFQDCEFASGEKMIPRHTAIIKSASGTTVTLLHQNLEGDIAKSVVRETKLDLASLKGGFYVLYMPSP